MKPVCLLVMTLLHSSIFWSFGSTLGDVVIFLEGGIPQIFEGMPASLVCVTNSTYSDRTWIKDGIEIGRCVDDIYENKTLPPGVSIIPGNDRNSETLFCQLQFTTLTISHHYGTYTCLGKTNTGTSKADTYHFAIRERKPFCDPEPVEYLLDDIAVFSCHNPNYYTNRTILWLHNNTDDVLLSLQSTQYDYTTRLNTVVKMTSGFNESVFSCHAFTQEQLETFNDTDNNYSCSVGPVVVYDAPFLSIAELKDTAKGDKLEKIVNCRLVPSQMEGKVWWHLPPSSFSYNISTLGASSNITLWGTGGSQAEVIELNVTCEAFYDGLNISSVYSLNFSTMSNRSPGSSEKEDKSGFLTPLNIVLCALGALIVITITVSFCTILCKLQRSEETPTYETDVTFTKERKETGRKNDVVELDTNLQRYHPEPSKSSQSPSQLIDQRQYDVPPFGGLNDNTHGETIKWGYQTDERIYDPATQEPADYYEMRDDMEDYADITYLS